ncbi:hypothetical protein B0H19DRAFT_527220 [Mycena capillaripes]|nr:hypothetical protein B0H19DRAFT_527220 [Mycena capillaripes]
MASAAPSDVGPTFVGIFGPLFWAFCVSLVLSGVTVLQGYLYFTRYSDKLLIRTLAGLMLFLDLLSTCLLTQTMYYYILPHYGSLAPLGAVTGELDVDCLISSVIAFISQMYFVYQLIVVKSRVRAALIMNVAIVVLGTISLGGGIGCVVIMFKYPHFIFMNRIRAFSIFAGIHKASGAAADVVATVAMLIFLKAADTGIRRTSSILRSLMYLVVNRGVLVTVAQVVTLIVLFASTSHLYWSLSSFPLLTGLIILRVAVHINTTRLYANTFFAMLNARTPPDTNQVSHFSMSGLSAVRAVTTAQTDSSFEVRKP